LLQLKRLTETDGQTAGQTDTFIATALHSMHRGKNRRCARGWVSIRQRRGLPAPIIYARRDRAINAIQLRRWQFSYKETL